MSLNEILASGGALLLFLTLVQITPIKVNPWSAVGKIIGNGMRAIGKSMNKDVMDKLESVQKELKELGEKHNKLEGAWIKMMRTDAVQESCDLRPS